MISLTSFAQKGLGAFAMAVAICSFFFLDMNLGGRRGGGHSSSLGTHYMYTDNERRLRTNTWALTNKAAASAPAAPPGKGVLLAGLVEDAKHISPSTIDFLVELSCQSHVVAHIFASKGVEDLQKSYKERSTRNGMENCADFFVEQDEADLVRTYPNRIDRLSHVRDMQRELLESFYKAHAVDVYNSPAAKDSNEFLINKQFEHVIVVDLDLHSTPTPRDVLRAIQDMDGSFDAICANGLTLDGKLPYDSYATVLLPDTFLGYFLRSDPTLMPKEDSSIIDAYIEATTSATGTPFSKWAKSLMSRFSGERESDPIPVKSCFGGMAIYRTNAWFANECKYTRDYTSDHVRYIAAGTGRVCEHVVFNHCLRNEYKDDFSMAVHRGLVTKYHEADPDAVKPTTAAATRGLKKTRKHKYKYGIFFSEYGKKYGKSSKSSKSSKSAKGNPYARKYGRF